MNSRHLFIISVIIIITACLVVMMSIGGSMVLDIKLTDEGRDLLGNVLNSLIVIVSMVIGNKSIK